MPNMRSVQHTLAVASIFSPWVVGVQLSQHGFSKQILEADYSTPQTEYILAAALRLGKLVLRLGDRPLTPEHVIQLLKEEEEITTFEMKLERTLDGEKNRQLFRKMHKQELGEDPRPLQSLLFLHLFCVSLEKLSIINP